MGQCYDVRLDFKFKDRKGAVKALQDKIGREKEEHTQYNLSHYEELGIGTARLDDLLRIFFGGWYGVLTPGIAGGLQAGFDASYGWEGVMMDAFMLLAPFLEDGSYLKIYPDSGRDYGIVENGKVNWE